MTDDERAIRALVDTWMGAGKAGDIHTCIAKIKGGNDKKTLVRVTRTPARARAAAARPSTS